MDKDLVEKTRQTLLAIDRMMQEINGYLIQLRRQADSEVTELQRRTRAIGSAAEKKPAQEEHLAALRRSTGDPRGWQGPGVHSWPPTTTEDTRSPYLSGRQPRRDGDSYGSVALGTIRGGADAKKGEDIRKR